MQYDYDVVVIGGGAAGLVAATGAAGFGVRVAMIEKNKLGGDCAWYGCIPSKALLKSAHVFSLLGRLDTFGLSALKESQKPPRDVMEHVRSVIAQVSSHHPTSVFEERGIQVLFGSPRFISNHAIQLNERTMSAKRFIIATGSHPFIPPIDGLSDVRYLTNETVFDLQELPQSLAVLGGGPIGVELAQAFSRLGVKVSIIEMLDFLLYREDREASSIVSESLIKEGVSIYTAKKALKCAQEKDAVVITLQDKEHNLSTLKAEKLLVAVGRAPNVGGLNLEAAGIQYTPKGIIADKTLRTSAKNIYVCGDVVGPYQFSHMAEYQAVIALGNALFPFKRKVNYKTVGWCTFTDPELAHLGLTEEEARQRHKDIIVYKAPYSANDRAVTEQETKGFSKVICDKKGRILGAHIVGAGAGELIHEYALVQSANLKIGFLSSTIHVYPTLAQIVKRSADQHYIHLLQSKGVRFLSKLMLRFLA